MTMIQRAGDALTLKPAGRFDFAACEALQAEFERELDAGFKAFTIDLSGCAYIDSAALGMLLYIDHVSGSDVAVRIVGVRGQVLDAVRKIHLDKVLNIST